MANSTSHSRARRRRQPVVLVADEERRRRAADRAPRATSPRPAPPRRAGSRAPSASATQRRCLVAHDVEPLLAALRHALGEARTTRPTTRISQHADRLAAAQRRAAVVRIVQVLQHHHQPAPGARAADAVELRRGARRRGCGRERVDCDPGIMRPRTWCSSRRRVYHSRAIRCRRDARTGAAPAPRRDLPPHVPAGVHRGRRRQRLGQARRRRARAGHARPASTRGSSTRTTWSSSICTASCCAARNKPSSEFLMHELAYAERPDVGAVVHAHPPITVGAGAGRRQPGAVHAVGDLPRPRRHPDRALLDADDRRGAARARPYMRQTNAIVMDRHGAITLGRNLDEAYNRLEAMEHAAKITHAARVLGPVAPLPPHEVDKLQALAQAARHPARARSLHAVQRLPQRHRRPDPQRLRRRDRRRRGPQAARRSLARPAKIGTRVRPITQ